MHIYSRAGLVALIFAFAITFTTAAPIAQDEFLPAVSVRSIHSANLNHKGPFTVAFQKEDTLAPEHHRAINLEEEMTLVRRKIHIHISSKVKHAFQKVGHAFKHVAQKIAGGVKTAAKKVGHAFKRVGQKVAGGVKTAARKVGHAFKHAAQKVGHGIKTAARKVGHFIKTTGAQVAKFGLKLVSTAEKIASKVVSFIPGVGKVVSKAIDGASAATNAISDRIHVKLPKKLQKGMNAMNKVRKISGYVPRDLSELNLNTREDFDGVEEREWEVWEGF